MNRISRKTFSDAAKKGQDNLREKLGEKAYRARLVKIGSKGGRNRKPKDVDNSPVL